MAGGLIWIRPPFAVVAVDHGRRHLGRWQKLDRTVEDLLRRLV